MTPHRQSAAHLDADQLNAFLAGALSEEARRESLAHLAVVFGYILEIGLTYWFVYSLKFLFSRRYETRKTRATA